MTCKHIHKDAPENSVCEDCKNQSQTLEEQNGHSLGNSSGSDTQSPQTKTQPFVAGGVGSFCGVELEQNTGNHLKNSGILIGEDKTADNL